MLINGKDDPDVLRAAKHLGISDKYIGQVWGQTEKDIFRFRKRENLLPVYKMIDTCASEFESYVPYFYSTYEEENESIVSDKKKIVVLGSGPIRIGQGVEFDYSTVHAIWTIQHGGYEAIIINNNPETVSTDYTTSDKLYFEPLTVEDVMNILTLEKPEGVVVSLGGQTAINLAERLHAMGVKIIGTDVEAIKRAGNRDSFEKVMQELGIPQPQGEAVTNIEAGVEAATRIGYPVLVRPSYVLGGRACRSSTTKKPCATTCAPPCFWTRTSPCWWINTSSARSWKPTPYATASRCTSPASWSTSSARASTRATASACTRPLRCPSA